MAYTSRITDYASRVNKIDPGLLIAAALALFAVQPLLKPGLPTSADLIIHLYRTLEFQHAWAPGVIVPRWAPHLAYGYGYPLFVFAPPLPYLLGTLLHLSGLTLEVAFKLLIILTFFLYAIGMYLFGRALFRSAAMGLVASVAYTFAPFALREALLAGGNIPQFLAIGLFPWALWAVTRAVRTQRQRWTVWAGIFYAAIMLSHLFQAFIFAPVLGAYILLLIWLLPSTPSQRDNGVRLTNLPLVRPHPNPPPLGEEVKSPSLWEELGEDLSLSIPLPLRGENRPSIPRSPARYTPLLPLLSLPLGLLLSAFFWLPAFIERFYTRAQSDIYLEKSPFFVRYPHWSELLAWIQPFDLRAANPYTPLTLGLVPLILATLGLLAGFVVSIRRSAVSGQRSAIGGYHSSLLTPHSSLLILLFFTLVAAGGAFMSLPASRRMWEIVEILQVAEFPWRMLGLANLGLAILAGAAMLLAPLKFRWVAATGAMVMLLGAVAPFLYPTIPFSQFGDPTLANQIQYERSSQSIGTTTLGEYLPQTVTRPPTTSPLVDVYQKGNIPDRLDSASLPQNAAATLLEQTAITHRYRLNSPTDFTLRLFHFDYPGWRAYLDNEQIDIATERDTGLMLIDIPARQHTLTVHFGEIPIRLVAMALTGLTVIGLIALARLPSPNGRGVGGEGIFSKENQPTPPPLATEGKIEGGLLADTPGRTATTLSLALIIVAAFGLKPLLQSLFTIESPPDRVLPAQHQADIRFANGIRLVGYDLSASIVQPGDYMQVVLYWQTEAAPHRVNLQPFVHLDRLDNFTTMAGSANYTPGDVTTESNMPTFHWDNERYVRDEHDLTLPADILPLAYAVRVGLIDPDQGGQLVPLADGSGDTAQIDLINVQSTNSNAVELAEALDVSFGNGSDVIHLTSFELTALTPQRLEFSLAWESDNSPARDYTVFAQLLDSNRQLVAGFDRPPLDGAYPTSTWLPHQTIIDPRYLPLADVDPGQYTLIVGLYDSASGARLTTGSVDYVELTTIAIEEP